MRKLPANIPSLLGLYFLEAFPAYFRVGEITNRVGEDYYLVNYYSSGTLEFLGPSTLHLVHIDSFTEVNEDGDTCRLFADKESLKKWLDWLEASHEKEKDERKVIPIKKKDMN